MAETKMDEGVSLNEVVKRSDKLVDESRKLSKRIGYVSEWRRQQAAAEETRRLKDAKDATDRERLREAIERDSSSISEPEPVERKPVREAKPKRTLADLGARMLDAAGKPVSDRSGRYDCYENGVQKRSDGEILIWVADDYPGGVMIHFKGPKRQARKSEK